MNPLETDTSGTLAVHCVNCGAMAIQVDQEGRAYTHGHMLDVAAHALILLLLLILVFRRKSEPTDR